jgi:hypothetical protein
MFFVKELKMKIKLETTVFLAVVIGLSACSPVVPTPISALSNTAIPPAEATTASVQATATPVITMTETATIPAIASETPVPPSATQEATPAVSLSAQVIPTLNAYCRKGPNTLYDIVTFIQKGIAYDVVGRDSLNTWWLVKAAGVNPCWVGASAVNISGPAEQVVVVQGQPLPEMPALFESSATCNALLKTLGVRLDWAAAQGATGYRIYRNGALVTTLSAIQTSYHDDAPVGVDLVYQLEAFNDYGVAVRVQTSVPACK